ncbi:MAG: Na+/H+ antiporter NhaC family protein [Lachnospiraceae bacterium]|nr:Na+/H+ antiporter NhaC family protein [Lachnospiraceae bacterium]
MSDQKDIDKKQSYPPVLKTMIHNLNPKNVQNPKMYYLWVLMIIVTLVMLAIPAKTIHASALTLIPIVTMFIYVIVSKDFVQGFMFGTLLAMLSCYKLQGAVMFVDNITNTLSDYDNMFTILTFFICGGTISALQASGAAKSFGKWVSRKIKSKKLSLFVTWVLSAVMSIDDYVCGLTVGTAMSPINDSQGVPREMTAYTIRSNASAPGLFYPMGDWAYFIIMQLVALGLVSGGVKEAVKVYMGYVPFLFYPMVAMFVAFLAIMGVIPKIGKMKKAYERMENGGPACPTTSMSEEELEELAQIEAKPDIHPANFIVPIIIMFGSMIFTGFDGVRAGAISLSLTGIFYIAQGIFNMKEYIEVMLEGFKDMIDLTILLVFGYMLGDVMADMGFADFIAGAASHIPIRGLIPVIVFLLFCITEYLCTLNWTLYVIALPILYQVAPAIGANLTLTVAALISAGLFGSNTCPFSDGGIVVSKGCRMDLYDHSFSSMPYFIIAGVVTAVMYLVAGLIMT